MWETQAVTVERVRWASGQIVRHGDRYFINNDRGDLIIARLSPKGYEEIDRTTLLKPTSPPGNRRALDDGELVASGVRESIDLRAQRRRDHLRLAWRGLNSRYTSPQTANDGHRSMFTLIHVLISVIAIVLGLVVAGGLIAGARLNGWTASFLATTVLTSVTGFFFPFTSLTPAHVVGAVSLVILGVCLVARYGKRLEGSWRRIYVVTAVAALYLNVFVLVVQLFQKTPALAALAPTQQEPPFAVTQLLVLALFVVLGRAALRGAQLHSPSGGDMKSFARTAFAATLGSAGVLTVVLYGQSAAPAPLRAQSLGVADNLYLLSGGGGGNALMMTAENGTVLVDTGATASGAELATIASTISDQAVTTVIYSHAHVDHTGGAAAIVGTPRIIAHEQTRLALQQLGLADRLLPAAMVQDSMTLFDGPDRIELR